MAPGLWMGDVSGRTLRGRTEVVSHSWALLYIRIIFVLCNCQEMLLPKGVVLACWSPRRRRRETTPPHRGSRPSGSAAAPGLSRPPRRRPCLPPDRACRTIDPPKSQEQQKKTKERCEEKQQTKKESSTTWTRHRGEGGHSFTQPQIRRE